MSVFAHYESSALAHAYTGAYNNGRVTTGPRESSSDNTRRRHVVPRYFPPHELIARHVPVEPVLKTHPKAGNKMSIGCSFRHLMPPLQLCNVARRTHTYMHTCIYYE